MSASPHDPGLRLIVVYKLVKAILALTTAAVFVVLISNGSSGALHELANDLRGHVTDAWATYLADALVSVTERRHLIAATAAIGLDGLCTLAEWYALSRGHVWGEWLVVAATSSLLPFEVVALVRHHHVGRFGVLAVNAAIVVYLARHARKRGHERRATFAPTAS